MTNHANSGNMDPTAATGQGGSSNPRNIQFRIPTSQQQQQQQQLHHLHHHHQQQQQQQHEASGHGSVTSNTQARIASNVSLSHQHQQQHSIQYPHPSSQHGSYNPIMQPLSQQPHQQRPPIPPAPRLHHSVSLGNISNAGRHGVIQSGAAPNAANTAPPKKKDPYATAWRTYSKIAEELHLQNPDGSLYPISKEAILKYLHHQSKRIKSTNLHWYVNGLKKHQETLGIHWDDIRYDEQVVSLLKELTLHPANAAENGDDDGYGGHTYGSQPNRQRQSSSSMYSSAKMTHHYSSSSIDTTRIANLSISQPAQHHPQSAQQQQQHQQHNHHPHPYPSHQKQQTLHGSSFGNTFKQHQSHQPFLPQQQQQQQQQQPQRFQPQLPPKYHSAPIATSHQDATYQHSGGYQHQHQHRRPSHFTAGDVGGAADVHSIRSDAVGHPGGSSLTKRKRDEFAFKKRRVPSTISMEGEDNEDDELQEDELKDDDFDDDRHGHDMDDFDEMEDPNRYQPLKRRASTGTLLSQAKAQAVKHIPGPFTLDQHQHGPTSYHPYSYQRAHLRESSAGGNEMTHHRNPNDQKQQQQQHLRSPSPDSRDNEPSDGNGNSRRPNDSPSASTTSNSSIGAQLGDKELIQRYRNASSGGTAGSPTNSVLPLVPEPPTSAIPSVPGKTTVQFSEVVERAQQLQAKYGNRCRTHPWGCVEISEHRHLELSIKMYLDWAGLVASGRLTMDELPDLPEFRNNHPAGGGTLRRMASTPLSSLSGSTLNTSRNGGIVQSSSPTIVAAEDSTFSGSSGRNYFDGPYRSPSSSPPSRHLLHHQQQRQEETHGKDSSSEVRNLREDINPSSAIVSAQRSIPSPPSGAHMSDNSTGINGEARPHHQHPRARKMPSTPSLGQHHRGLDHPSHHRTDKRGSTSSNSTASSPPSDADMLEDDEDVGEDEETNDASHYALSPWAKAPKDIADARAAAVRARSVKGGHELQPFQERAFTPQGGSSDQGLRSQQDDDEADPVERKQSRQQTEGTITEELRGGPILAMDAEGAVVAIGEIPHSTEVGSAISTTGGGSRENLCGNTCHETERSADVTITKGLESSLSEFGEDDRMQTDEVDESRTAMETERKAGRSKEGEDRPDHEASLGAKDMKVDRNPMQTLESKQELEQEDSVMAEI